MKYMYEILGAVQTDSLCHLFLWTLLFDFQLGKQINV